MKKNITKLDIEIREGVDKIYGIDNLPEAQRNKKHRALIHGSRMVIKADNAKLKLYHFVKTTRGQQFVNELSKYSYKILANKYNIPCLLTFKNNKRIADMIAEVLTRANIAQTTQTITPKKEYFKYSRHYTEPKNITSGRQKYTKVTETILRSSNDPDVPVLLKDASLTPIRYGGWITFVSTRWERANSIAGKFAREIQHLNTMSHEQYLIKLENYKMEKWIRKHPKPTEDQLKNDLFPELMNVEWNTREHNAREFIRNKIIAKYDKTSLPVIGRFELSDNSFEERILGYVKDKYNFANHINDDYYGNEMNPILKKAYEIFDAAVQVHSNLDNGYIQNAAKTIGRVLLPKHSTSIQLNVTENSTINLEDAYDIAALYIGHGRMNRKGVVPGLNIDTNQHHAPHFRLAQIEKQINAEVNVRWDSNVGRKT